MMTVLTLIMGFSITGAVISINFEATDTFQSEHLISFVMLVTKAILYSAFGLGVTFFISVLAAQLHGNKMNRKYVTIFFKLMLLPTLIAELCIYQSLNLVFSFTGEYIELAYSSPARILCPHASSSPYFDPNAFCARLSQTMWDAAISEDVCGSPQNPARQPRNQMDMDGLLCMVVDHYQRYFYDRQIAGYKTQHFQLSEAERGLLLSNGTLADIQKVWFGYFSNWTWVGITDEVWSKQIARSRVWVDFTSARLSDVECGTDKVEKAEEIACAGSVGSVACASAMQARYQSGVCADNLVEDIWRCNRACDWINVKQQSFLGFNYFLTKPGLNSVYDAYKPIGGYLEDASYVMTIVIWARVFMFVMLRLYAWGRHCCVQQHSEEADSDMESFDDEPFLSSKRE